MTSILRDMSVDLMLGVSELQRLVRSAPRRYKVYEIPKKNPGQFRTIAQPAREVKALQRWVLSKVLTRFPVHAAATGYQKNKSILNNALPHAVSKYLLKLDFKEFFPSINAEDFRILARRHLTLEPDDIETLVKILFWKQKGSNRLCLSIGAPTSPMLSNIVMFEFDTELTAFCSKQGVAYTRYADDLALSSDSSEALRKAESYVGSLCKRLTTPTLILNPDKVVRVSTRESRRVTGLTLTNAKTVSLGRGAKRLLRAHVHHFATGRLKTEDEPRLRGMLAFVNAVEPSFLKRLEAKFGEETIRRIQRG